MEAAEPGQEAEGQVDPGDPEDPAVDVAESVRLRNKRERKRRFQQNSLTFIPRLYF